MTRLKCLILLFCAALSIPLGYMVWHTHHSLKQEEIAELRYFARNLFERMEEELAALIRKEEARAVDDYTYHLRKTEASSGSDADSLSEGTQRLAYILGYLQNNPDGSFQSPLFNDAEDTDSLRSGETTRQLREVNRIFNQKRSAVATNKPLKPAKMRAATIKEADGDIAEKYFDASRSRKKSSYLGRQARRVEKVPARQALNIAPRAEKEVMENTGSMAQTPVTRQHAAAPSLSTETASFRVEVDPMQSVLIDLQRVFIFRRIVIHDRIYRQGFIVSIDALLRHLADTHFTGQPMARFTELQLHLVDQGQGIDIFRCGAQTVHPVFSLHQNFPRPFCFIQATLACDRIPPSAGRLPLNITIGLTTGILFLGLLAIYHSTRTQVELSKRRSNFVSSVTHELKTPLTTIRMYIEMLEQGMARTKEREQAYFGILLSESARLSRLINNVLEFSRLEKKQRRVNLTPGTLRDVIREVGEVMQEKLQQEGFTLNIVQKTDHRFAYDREMMIQILINLLENSIKFGREARIREITIRVRRQDERMLISVSDTGPGIPPRALKKVFEDFYRVDNEAVRNTKGTGIGLALVKQFMSAMGGHVAAVNNTGPGCTVTLSLPA